MPVIQRMDLQKLAAPSSVASIAMLGSAMAQTAGDTGIGTTSGIGELAAREIDRRRFCRDSLYLAAAGLLAGKGVVGSVMRAQSLSAAPAPVASAQYAFFDGVVSRSMNEAAVAASAQPPARSDFPV